MKIDKARFVEVMDSTEGKDAVIVNTLLNNMFDVRYERKEKVYSYYRLRATRKEVKLLTKQLEALGYHYTALTTNRYFHVYERAQ